MECDRSGCGRKEGGKKEEEKEREKDRGKTGERQGKRQDFAAVGCQKQAVWAKNSIFLE